MIKIKRLGHVCLGTTDLNETLDFYCGILACRVIHEFRNANGQLYGVFLKITRGNFLEFFLEKNPSPGGFFRHICFEVDDIERVNKTLNEKGFKAEIRRGKTDRVLQFWIQDPDGNMIEFHQYDEQCIQFKHL